MKNGIKNFLTEITAFLIPIISTIIFVLILYIPRSANCWILLRQAPFFAGIYFWQTQRPDIFSIFSAFILGILADVMGNTPLGIDIMTFLMLYIISMQLSLRFNAKKFSYSWFLFALACLLTFIFKALIASILYRQLIPLSLLFIELLMTIAIYPLIAHVNSWIERRYIHLEERYEEI